MKKRLGRITVSDDLVRDMIFGRGNTTIFSDIFPVDIQRDMSRGVVTYICAGECFDVVPEAEIVPVYDVIFDQVTAKPKFIRSPIQYA